MPLTKITGFFFTFTDGDLLFVPEHCMPFEKEPKKVLADFEAEFYLNSPLYPSTVEVRIDTTGAVLMPQRLDRRLVTVLGQVESRLSRGIEQPWVIAEMIVTHGDIADRAHAFHLSGRGGSAEDDWVRAENELLAARPSLSETAAETEAA